MKIATKTEYQCPCCGYRGDYSEYNTHEDHTCVGCGEAILEQVVIVPFPDYNAIKCAFDKLPKFADTGEAFVVGPDVAYVKYEGQVYKALSAWFWEEDGVWCYQLDAGRSARYWPPLSAYSTVEAALAAKEIEHGSSEVDAETAPADGHVDGSPGRGPVGLYRP